MPSVYFDQVSDSALLRRTEAALLSRIQTAQPQELAAHYVLLGRCRQLQVEGRPLEPKERAAGLSWLWDFTHGPARGHA